MEPCLSERRANAPRLVKLERPERALEVIRLLSKEYPVAKTALKHRNALEMLVSTMLSAQTTDERVNMVTDKLFKKYRSAKDYAEADLKDLERIVHSVNFYRTKSRNLKKVGQMLLNKFGGRVPKTMEEMLELPGVARKTANIVLTNAYGVTEGIAVDTHVRRTSKRLGLTEKDDPEKIEQDLMQLVPKESWGLITDLLITLGRRVCVAKKPKCEICVLNSICPSAFTFG